MIVEGAARQATDAEIRAYREQQTVARQAAEDAAAAEIAMAMLLDGPPSTIGDLSIRDSDLLDVAAAEGIDLSAKLQLAATDIGNAVESMLLSLLPLCGLIRQRFPSLRHIAVTQQLKLWHTFSSLRLVYQDLYYSRLNDRYQAKMKMYREEELQALNELRTVGFGIVFDPLPQALAPNVAMVQSAGSGGGTVYVAVSYVNQKDEEGLASLPIEADVPSGNAATVNLTALADNATAWNLYAGVSPDALSRQNSQTLDPLAAPTLVPANLGSGPRPGSGQHANQLYPLPRRILRG
jgi:hypothetical protein